MPGAEGEVGLYARGTWSVSVSVVAFQISLELFVSFSYLISAPRDVCHGQCRRKTCSVSHMHAYYWRHMVRPRCFTPEVISVPCVSSPWLSILMSCLNMSWFLDISILGARPYVAVMTMTRIWKHHMVASPQYDRQEGDKFHC